MLVISHVSTILAGEILSLTWSQEKLLLVGLCCSMFVPWSDIHNTIQLLVNLWNESTCIPSLRGPLASMALFNDCEKSYLWHIYIYTPLYTHFTSILLGLLRRHVYMFKHVEYRIIGESWIVLSMYWSFMFNWLVVWNHGILWLSHSCGNGLSSNQLTKSYCIFPRGRKW